MIFGKKQIFGISLLQVILIIIIIWNIGWMAHQRKKMNISAQSAAECRVLAGSIESLRQQTPANSVKDLSTQKLGENLDAAMQNSNIDAKLLKGVYPQASRNINNSEYIQKSVTLELRKITMMQLVSFLCCLTESSGIKVRELRLRCPHENVPDNLWDAEATLTYLVRST
jgi:uncharacterized membrane protein